MSQRAAHPSLISACSSPWGLMILTSPHRQQGKRCPKCPCPWLYVDYTVILASLQAVDSLRWIVWLPLVPAQGCKLRTILGTRSLRAPMEFWQLISDQDLGLCFVGLFFLFVSDLVVCKQDFRERHDLSLNKNPRAPQFSLCGSKQVAQSHLFLHWNSSKNTHLLYSNKVLLVNNLEAFWSFKML